MSTPDTNGRAPADAPDPDEAAPPPIEDVLEDDVDDELYDDFDDGVNDESRGTEVAFTPRQILGGFALLAALILLLRRRNRGR